MEESNTKEIKDYLPLYLGCECLTDDGRRGWFSGFDVCEKDYSIVMITVRFPGSDEDWSVLNDNEECDRIKPLLRPLSDMTEEEKLHWFNRVKKEGETLEESVWTTELNGQPCDPHWSLWMKERWNGCRCAYTVGINNHFTADEFVWLLSKGFDLFGLIEAGLAIDRT